MTTEMPAWLGYHSFSKSKMCFLFYHRAVRHKVNVCKQYNKKITHQKWPMLGLRPPVQWVQVAKKKKKIMGSFCKYYGTRHLVLLLVVHKVEVLKLNPSGHPSMRVLYKSTAGVLKIQKVPVAFLKSP